MRDDYAPLSVGNDEDEDGAVLARLASGEAVLLPAALKSLRGDALDAVAEVQGIARQIRALQDDLDQAVEHVREDFGVSWSSIGFLVGTSGEAARQRWGVR